MFSKRLSDLNAAIASCVYSDQERILTEDDALQLFYRMMAETVAKQGIIYVIGNGGSAGIASHFSNDLMKALQIPSQTLYDSNLMTCLANDLGYENVFSYPLERLIKSNDLLVAISSSGQSPNILKAVDAAQAKSAAVITLSGFKPDNPLRKQGNLNFWIDRRDYGLVETAHFFLLHTVIDLWGKVPLTVMEYA
jgi:D-sedoheptulose 7-phosphate isomerase